MCWQTLLLPQRLLSNPPLLVVFRKPVVVFVLLVLAFLAFESLWAHYMGSTIIQATVKVHTSHLHLDWRIDWIKRTAIKAGLPEPDVTGFIIARFWLFLLSGRGVQRNPPCASSLVWHKPLRFSQLITQRILASLWRQYHWTFHSLRHKAAKNIDPARGFCHLLLAQRGS